MRKIKINKVRRHQNLLRSRHWIGQIGAKPLTGERTACRTTTTTHYTEPRTRHRIDRSLIFPQKTASRALGARRGASCVKTRIS